VTSPLLVYINNCNLLPWFFYSDRSTEVEENSELESSDDKTSDVYVKLIKN
jgi:hypothetical protein